MTRLGLAGIPRAPYGSFAGKTAAPTTGPHNPGRITRLGLYGSTRGLYGDFSGKEAAVVGQQSGSGVHRLMKARDAAQPVRRMRRVILADDIEEDDLKKYEAEYALILLEL